MSSVEAHTVAHDVANQLLSVVVFAYNEADNLETVLGRITAWAARSQDFEAEIVFVDDGSTDATAEAAARILEESGVRHQVHVHPNNRGIGASLKTGAQLGTGSWLTFLPADGQIAPEAVTTLFRAAKHAGANLVLSTYDNRDDGWQRSVLSWGVRTLIRSVHGVQLRSQGPYLCRREDFIRAPLHSDTFFLNFEFPIWALRQRIPTTGATITCYPRHSGHSKCANTRKSWGVARELISLRLRNVTETRLSPAPQRRNTGAPPTRTITHA